MWTKENRGRYDRSKLRYPSDVTNEEWALIEPLIPPAKGGGKATEALTSKLLPWNFTAILDGCAKALER